MFLAEISPEILYPVLSLLAALLVLLSWGYLARKSCKRRGKEIESIRNDWGKPTNRSRDFTLYSKFMRAYKNPDEDSFLDNHTWRDLNLDLVFAHLDRTYSLPGEFGLYGMIRVPEKTPDVLQDRDEAISLFQSDVPLRENIQVQLTRLGHTTYDRGVLELLWGQLPTRSRFVPLYRLLSILVVVVLAVSILLGAYGLPFGTFAFLSLGTIFAINFAIHYWTKRILGQQILSIRYLSKMVVTGRRLSKSRTRETEAVELKALLEKMGRHADATAAIPSATIALVPERGFAFDLIDLLQEHLSVLFLIEVRAFYAILNEIQHHRADLHGLFQALGELDALQAIASYREGIDSYCKPKFVADRIQMEVTDAFHPLLESPVPNSISLTGQACVVTGSNMSGKSTFLRTLGVCAVLAQSTYTCPARAYEGSIFRIVSSVSPVDDLMQGKSFYFVEAERLLAMVRFSQGSAPVLCIVDELLRGTNSIERLAASEEILSYLAKSNTVVVAATHDLELVDHLDGIYVNYHFTDDVDASGLKFDYQLRPGKATTTNAINLLEQLDFPEEIVENARRKALKETAIRPRKE